MTDLDGKEIRKNADPGFRDYGLGIGQFATLPICLKTAVIFLLSNGIKIGFFTEALQHRQTA